MKLKEVTFLLKDAVSSWLEDDGGTMGAALAYYTLFSLAPLLVIVIAIAGLVFGPEAAQGQVLRQLEGLIGRDGAAVIQNLLRSASDEGRSTGAAIIGGVTFLLGATGVFSELQGDLNRIWREPNPRKPKGGLVRVLRDKVLTIGMIMGIGFLMLVSTLVSAALTSFGDWIGGMFTGWPVALEILNSVISFVIIALCFAMIYRFLPRVRIGWRDVWMGAAVTALLFTVGKLLIGIYLGTANVASTYGAAGSLVVLLVWVYYSAQIFLLGAEFTWVFAYRHGSRKNQHPPARVRSLPPARQTAHPTRKVPAKA